MAKVEKNRKKNKKDAPLADLWSADPREALSVGREFHLAAVDRGATPGWKGDEKDARRYARALTPLLSDLQERLFAASKAGSQQRVLVVVQGLDTAGKGGIARHVMGLVDPQGVALTAFKKPTEEEASHDFLWRIRRAVPGPGMIGMFDRSHYEDILVPGANGQLDQGAFDWRVDQIRGFEQELADSGTALIKVALMVSYEEQGRRLLERLDHSDKHWKYSPGDMDVRGQWFDYQSIYQRMLPATSFEFAPWHVVPADNKWYARLSVTEMLLRTLAEMEVTWPEATFDVEAERARVRATMSSSALSDYDAGSAKRVARAVTREEVFTAAAQAISAESSNPASENGDDADQDGENPGNDEETRVSFISALSPKDFRD